MTTRLPKRRIRGVLAGLVAVFLGAGALVTGATAASAATATGAGGATTTRGTVTLSPRSNSLTDGSPFSQVSVDRTCPPDFQDNVSVYLVAPDGTESTIAFHVTDGGPFSGRTLTATIPAASTDTTFVNSIADAFDNVNARVADGTYPIHVVCGSADPVNHPERPTFTGFINVTGDTWQPAALPAPVPTRIRFTASPARHVQVGQTFTLTARVVPAVTGTLQFSADGGANPIGTPVQVVNGVASVVVPTNSAPSVREYDALFVPADQLAVAEDFGVFHYTFVDTPSITATAADGTALGTDPQLTPGQQITLDATGFQPGTGEQVRVRIPYAHVPFPTAGSDANGAVTDYHLTVPSRLRAGAHQITLTGTTSHIRIAFPFTVKRP